MRWMLFPNGKPVVIVMGGEELSCMLGTIVIRLGSRNGK